MPRGLIAGTLAAIALVWGLYAISPGGSLVSALVQSGVYLGLLMLTTYSRRAKVRVVRTLQRCTINPLMRLLLTIGVNPLGLAILETRGHASGRIRRVPVGNGRSGDSFWIIAEHGRRAGYVRNITHDPRVRVRLRIGARYRWVPGIATLRPDDDPLARQRRVVAWHPLRALNAINVRVLGADLLTVHVQLDLDQADPPRRPGSTHTGPIPGGAEAGSNQPAGGSGCSRWSERRAPTRWQVENARPALLPILSTWPCPGWYSQVSSVR